jgi:hypothetical protein
MMLSNEKAWTKESQCHTLPSMYLSSWLKLLEVYFDGVPGNMVIIMIKWHQIYRFTYSIFLAAWPFILALWRGEYMGIFDNGVTTKTGVYTSWTVQDWHICLFYGCWHTHQDESSKTKPSLTHKDAEKADFQLHSTWLNSCGIQEHRKCVKNKWV